MPDPRLGERDEDVVDGALRADVDATGGLVGDQHARLAKQHAREERLLLVTARERADAIRRVCAAYVAALENGRRLPAFGAAPHDREAAQACEDARASRSRVPSA